MCKFGQNKTPGPIPCGKAAINATVRVDVTKIDKSYPMFVLAGCIFDLDDYSKNVEPKIDELKRTYFSRTDIILRSYDIRKQKKDFAKLVDKKLRDNFYADLNECIRSINFTIIAAAINKLSLIDQYTTPSNPYNLCLWFILERAVMFLGRGSEQMLFRAESRETHNDKQLAETYERFREKGSGGYIDSVEVKRKFTDLSFNQKIQNIVGHQIADLVAYPIGKWVLDKSKGNKAFEIIEQKFHRKNGDYINCGLKIFP